MLVVLAFIWNRLIRAAVASVLREFRTSGYAPFLLATGLLLLGRIDETAWMWVAVSFVAVDGLRRATANMNPLQAVKRVLRSVADDDDDDDNSHLEEQ